MWSASACAPRWANSTARRWAISVTKIGHHYWDLLIANTGYLEPFRALFGDETVNYEQALQAHYGREPIQGWQDSFVSLYATSHPWEDFAETWAHYLHIIDTLEMAASFGVGIHPKLSRDPAIAGGHRNRPLYGNRYDGDPRCPGCRCPSR